MTNIQAAIGCAQLKKIDLYISERKNIFDHYNKSFFDKNFLLLLPTNNWSTNSYWLYSIVLKNFGKFLRNKIIKLLQNKGIECRPGFPSLSSLPVFNKFSNGAYPISNFLSENLISFPSNNLTKFEQDFIIKSFFEIIKSLDNSSKNL
jgi:dTDP-4-amino-4,6-dideoxygalactose transaminase